MAKSKAELKLHWKGIYYEFFETCVVNFYENEFLVHSIIEGNQAMDVRCEYEIKTTPAWKVVSFEIENSFNKISHHISGSHTGTGWIINNRLHEEFKNCVDIDITLTPFTNSLPINRLDLAVDKPQKIEVVYLDVLKNNIRVAHQQYTKKSETNYNFQNIPNDFEANIITDNKGFVVHYPELFERIEY